MNRKSKLPTRRDLFSAASLTAAGFAAAVTTPETAVALPVATEKKFSTLESFKYDIESETGWVGPAGSAKEATVLHQGDDCTEAADDVVLGKSKVSSPRAGTIA